MHDIVENRRIKEEIGKKLVDGELAVFIGAGLSAGIVPTWFSFIDECIKPVGLRLIQDYWSNQNQDYLKKVFDACVGIDESSVLGGFNKALRQSNQKLTTAMANLGRLNIPLYVTTNYDYSLSQALRGKNPSVVRYENNTIAGNITNNSLYYLHGYTMLKETTEAGHLTDNIVLGTKSFEIAYNVAESEEDVDGPARAFFKALLDSYSVLFLGFNPTEKCFSDVLQGYKNKGRNYIVLPDPTDARLEYEYESTLGSKLGKKYTGLDDIERSSFKSRLQETRQAKIAKDLRLTTCFYELDVDDHTHSHFSDLVSDWTDGDPLLQRPEPDLSTNPNPLAGGVDK